MELNNGWKKQTVPFHFRVGERTLFSKEFTLLVQNAFLNNGDLDVPLYSAEQGRVRSDVVDGFLLRSKKIEGNVPKLTRKSGWIQFIPKIYYRYYIDLSGTFDDYVQKFSKKSLSTIRRKVRRFRDYSGGALKWRVYRTPKEIGEFRELARKVSEKSYQERLLDAGLPNNKKSQEKMNRLAQQDQVRGFLLFDQDLPVSYLYCPVYKGRMVYEYLGYDPRYHKWSPGTILQWLALEEVFSEKKFILFDFTEGQNDHKRFFSNGSVLCGDLYYLIPSKANTIWAVSYSSFNGIVEKVSNLAEEWKLRAMLRKFLRKTN